EVEMYGGGEEEGVEHHHGAPRNDHKSFIYSFIWSVCALGLCAIALLLIGISVDLIVYAKKHTPLVSLSETVKMLHEDGITALLWLGMAVMLTSAFYYIMQNNWIWRTHRVFNDYFEKFRKFYGGFLAFALHHRIAVLAVFIVFVLGSCILFP